MIDDVPTADGRQRAVGDSQHVGSGGHQVNPRGAGQLLAAVGRDIVPIEPHRVRADLGGEVRDAVRMVAGTEQITEDITTDVDLSGEIND